MSAPLAPPERAVVRAVNAERVARGLPALRAARTLSRSAEGRTRDQLRYGRLSHTSSDGTPFARRIARAGTFRVAGELLAFAPRGVSSRAREIVRMWLASPVHRAALLDGGYRIIGVGRARGAMRGQRVSLVTADLAAR